MTAVQNTVRTPSGAGAASAGVRIRLITGNGGVGYTSDGDIIGVIQLTADSSGHWSQALTATSAITPTGTYYEVTETTTAGAVAVSHITVPPSGGPYNLAALLVGVPTSPTTQYIPATASGVSGGVATLDSGGYVPLSQLGNVPGGAGVSSVNGHNGVVVLTPGDVSALAVASNLADVASPGAARTSLGLGNSSTRAVGTTAGTVAAGDDSRFVAVNGMDQVFPLSGYGLRAASGDPLQWMAVAGLSNNTLFLARTWIPAGTPITNLWCAVRDAGVHDGSTAGNRLGLYTDAGTLVDQTPDDPTLWTSNGWRGGALVGGAVAPQGAGRFVYISPLARGMTTPANIPFPSGATDSQIAWFGTGLQTHRRAIILSASSFPASFDPASAGSSTTFVPMVGVS